MDDLTALVVADAKRRGLERTAALQSQVVEEVRSPAERGKAGGHVSAAEVLCVRCGRRFDDAVHEGGHCQFKAEWEDAGGHGGHGDPGAPLSWRQERNEMKACLRACIQVIYSEFGGCLASHGQPGHICLDFCKTYHEACTLVGEAP